MIVIDPGFLLLVDSASSCLERRGADKQRSKASKNRPLLAGLEWHFLARVHIHAISALAFFHKLRDIIYFKALMRGLVLILPEDPSTSILL